MDKLKLEMVYYFRAPRDRNFNSTIIPKGWLYIEILLGGIVLYENRTYRRGALFAQSEGMETIHDFPDGHPYRALLISFSGYDPVKHPLPHIGHWMSKRGLDLFIEEALDAFFEDGKREELRNYLFATVEWNLVRSCSRSVTAGISYHNLLDTRKLLASPDRTYCDWKGLSARAGYNPAYLGALFKKEFGVTPYQFHLNARLERAAFALRSTQIGIRQICTDTGFQNIESFYRAFKRHFGVPPAEYREQNAAATSRAAME